MKIAFILFDHITWLDLVGVYDPVSRLKSMGFLPGMQWDFCSYSETTADQFGFTVLPTKIKNPLQDYDAIIVPGGPGARPLLHNKKFLDWFRTAAPVPYKTSVCTGSLLLGAAGFLRDKKATTHYGEYETLRPYCASVLSDRIVEDGTVITAGAVAASLDLGLYLCSKWAGAAAARDIQNRMNY